MTKFVIYGTPRTGTTLLVQLLDSHPKILCIGEALKRPSVNIRHAELSYEEYRKLFIGRRITDLFNRKASIQRYLDYVYNISDFEAVGFKYHHIQGRRFPTVTSYFRVNNVKVIRIVRQNLLKKYVSLLSARKSRIFATSTSVTPRKVKIDLSTVIQELTLLENEERVIEEETSGLDQTVVVYEKLATDIQAESVKLYNFLNVDSDVQASTQTKKINPDNLEEIIENYDEVAALLRSTQFSSCL